jgi:putative copper resistance protein D
MDNFLFLPRSLAAALYDAAFAAAFGFVLANLWLQPEGDATVSARLRHGTRLSAVAMLLAVAAQAYLTTATMVGSAALAEVRGQLWTVLTGTHAGRNLLAAIALLLISLPALALRTRAQSRAQTWIALGLLTTLAAVRAASGHAAADGDLTLPEYIQCIHLTSIAIWSGGVIAAGLIVLPAFERARNSAEITAFTRKLSRTVTIALVCIVLSGVYNAYRGLAGSLKPLATTQWGALLDAKLALVFIALAMGATNRRILQTGSALTPQQSARLTRTLRAEAVVMLLILAVSAFLANSPPADMPM